MNISHVELLGYTVELVMSARKAYPSDVTDGQWALIGPFLDAWRAKRISVAGRLGEQDLREIVNAFCIRTGPVAGERVCRTICPRSR